MTIKNISLIAILFTTILGFLSASPTQSSSNSGNEISATYEAWGIVLGSGNLDEDYERAENEARQNIRSQVEAQYPSLLYDVEYTDRITIRRYDYIDFRTYGLSGNHMVQVHIIWTVKIKPKYNWGL